MSTASGAPWRWVKRLLPWAVLLALAWGLRQTVAGALEELREHPVSPRPGWLVLSGALYLIGIYPCAWYYDYVLRSLGQFPAWRESLRAYYISHLGKYIPGKGWTVVLRAGLIRGSAVAVLPATVAAFVETLTMVAGGSAMAAGILLLSWPQHRALTLSALGVAAAAAALVSPPLLNLTAYWMLKRRGAAATAWRLNWSTIVVGWLAMAPVWFTLSLSLWATLRGLGAEIALPGDLPRLFVAVSLALCLGFASLVPAGAGVRELLLLELLAPWLGSGIAAASAVVLRLVWMSSEVVASIILYSTIRGRRWGDGPDPPPPSVKP